MHHTFAHALDDTNNVRMVFCDISSAFDRVWHQGLLYKLETVGISGPLLMWFKDYLSDRTQQVVIQGQTSSTKMIQAGVPQGSVLGPLLFLVFINDLPNIVKSDIRLFADDTSLYIITDDIQESAKKLNIDLQEINKWAKKWLVNFNPTKTESLLITTKKYSSIPPLVFDGKIVTEVNSHKHLGIIITTDLTWTAHIDAIV